MIGHVKRALLPTSNCNLQNLRLSLNITKPFLFQEFFLNFSSEAPSNTTSESNNSNTIMSVNKKRNTKVLKMDPSEYEDTYVGLKRPPLSERRGEANSVFKSLRLRNEDDPPGKMTDDLVFMQSDIELTPAAWRRFKESVLIEEDIKLQTYNQQRVAVLGRDLGAAHFVVRRQGKVRFMGHQHWISNYRNDLKSGESEEDLPALSPETCSLPVKYDPNFRVEALDASGVAIRYEGFANLRGLNYLKWASFRENKFLNDWCLDRIFCNHAETLEYLDVSGCRGLSACGLGGAWRLTKLKTLVVENLPQVKDLEVLCAVLEDQIPGLVCVGVDFEKKLNDMRQEALDRERQTKEAEEAIEANTVEVIPRTSNGERDDSDNVSKSKLSV